MIEKIKFIIDIKVKGGDYCESDLQQAIKEGTENIGNYEIKKINIIRIYENEHNKTIKNFFIN